VAGDAAAPRAVAVQPRQHRPQHAVADDQREHGGEAHLEADAHHHVRREEDDHRHGDGQAAQGQRTAADDHAERHQARHGEAALDRHVRAGEQQVGTAGSQRCQGGDLLGGRPKRHLLVQHQQQSQGDEDGAHDDADVQPGDSQQMCQP